MPDLNIYVSGLIASTFGKTPLRRMECRENPLSRLYQPILVLAWILVASVALLAEHAKAQKSLGHDPVGSINGRIAIKMLPQTSDPKDLDLKSCEAHLVQVDNQSTELVYRCGTWFQPPIGRYLFWLQQNERISYQSVITYAGEAFRTGGLALSKSMYPAGYVRLSSDTATLPLNSTLRLISLNTLDELRPFDRRIERPSAKLRVTAPTGDAIVGLFDRQGRALLLSRPKAVRSASITEFTPHGPMRSRANLVVILERSQAPFPAAPCSVNLKLGETTVGSPIPPLVNFQPNDRVVLIWYDLTAPCEAELVVQCPRANAYRRTTRLMDDVTTTLRGRVTPAIASQPPGDFRSH